MVSIDASRISTSTLGVSSFASLSFSFSFSFSSFSFLSLSLDSVGGGGGDADGAGIPPIYTYIIITALYKGIMSDIEINRKWVYRQQVSWVLV
jgi:hypothetical protein